MAQDLTDLDAALAEAELRVQELTRREQRLIEAQRISGVGSYDFEIATNTNTWSDQLYRIYGREPQSFNASYERFLELVHPDDRERVIAVHRRALATLSPYEMEERIVWPDGQVRTLASWGEVVGDDEGKPVRMVGICWDITEQRLMEERLRHGALHDALTGLPNRALIEDRLALAVTALARHELPLGLLFIDIDRFTIVNDSLGHDVGDVVLQEVSKRLSDAVRPGDTVARFGGDEFAVLCEEVTSAGEVLGIAQRIQQAISRPIEAAGTELVLSVSTGIAVTADPEASPVALLRDADSAMARAKQSGRARSVVFVDEMRDELLSRLEIETQLRRALAEGQLRVHYQPVLGLRTRTTIGLEALVRWEHPTRGMVPPAEFIPIAEETGLVVPLGEWVLEEACRQLSSWGSLVPDLTMSVNLSAAQIGQPDLAGRIAGILARTGVPAHRLALEITESVLMRDAEEALLVLRALKDLGVAVHVDDFGTGYSSLSYLKRFPVDALKIDRSFVDGLADDAEDLAIVKAIIGLARSLGMATIAEGVESPEQLAALDSLGCDAAQGFLFSQPVAPCDLAATIMEAVASPVAAVPAARQSLEALTRAER